MSGLSHLHLHGILIYCTYCRDRFGHSRCETKNDLYRTRSNPYRQYNPIDEQLTSFDIFEWLETTRFMALLAYTNYFHLNQVLLGILWV